MGQYRYALNYHYIVPPITLSNGAGSRQARSATGGINPAQGPKGDPAAGPIKIYEYFFK